MAAWLPVPRPDQPARLDRQPGSVVLGLMQDVPLLVSGLLRHAATNFPTREVIARLHDGRIHRTDYQRVERRARRLATALAALGIGPGDRVGTLAWNTHRHLEAFFGVPGMGAVLHTVNPRLFREQIQYIIAHAEDRVLLVDVDLLPIAEALLPQLPSVECVVALCERTELPPSTLPLVAYEDLIATGTEDYAWPLLDERQACGLCYTSGTTGNPKGVLYSHRSNVLHALGTNQPGMVDIHPEDVVMPVVPMFHANAWGFPHTCTMAGAKQVLPGNRLDPVSLLELIHTEGVTVSGGVPTVITALADHLAKTGQSAAPLRRVLVGGSALAPALQDALRERHAITAVHAWGMTEISPIGTLSTLTAAGQALPPDEQRELLRKQGREVFGVEMKIVDSAGVVAPKDGVTFGPLLVRGPWVAARYFRDEGGDVLDAQGWFNTGDVATWDEHGFMKITDRTKDVIKSGGEWISSIDLENVLLEHPKVARAAAVGAFHPKWDERPVVVIVPAPGEPPTVDELLAFLAPKVAKWWLPDAIVFVGELPLNATGKVQKSVLRERYWHHLGSKD